MSPFKLFHGRDAGSSKPLCSSRPIPPNMTPPTMMSTTARAMICLRVAISIVSHTRTQRTGTCPGGNRTLDLRLQRPARLASRRRGTMLLRGIEPRAAPREGTMFPLHHRSAWPWISGRPTPGMPTVGATQPHADVGIRTRDRTVTGSDVSHYTTSAQRGATGPATTGVERP